MVAVITLKGAVKAYSEASSFSRNANAGVSGSSWLNKIWIGRWIDISRSAYR